MKTLKLSAADAVSLASMTATTATGTDAKVTPVLSEISITVRDGELIAYATDRFCLAEFQANGQGPDGELRLTADVCKFVLANVKKGRGYGNPEPVEFTYSEETREISARHGLAVIGDTWSAAKFPAVSTLVSGWTAADNAQAVTLRAAFLARLSKFIDEFAKVDYWLIRLGADANARADRPGPVMATAGRFRVLIMPNTYKRP